MNSRYYLTFKSTFQSEKPKKLEKTSLNVKFLIGIISILLHWWKKVTLVLSLNPIWQYVLVVNNIFCCLKMKSVENILRQLKIKLKQDSQKMQQSKPCCLDLVFRNSINIYMFFRLLPLLMIGLFRVDQKWSNLL